MDLTVIIPLGPDDPWPKDLASRLQDNFVPVLISATHAKPSDVLSDIAWLDGPQGRPQQINKAFSHTQTSWLWLIHADSSLDSQAIATALDSVTSLSKLTIGHGHLRFANDGPRWMGLNALGANIRSRCWGQPYGDQSLLIHRTLWQSLGGFCENIGRGEDLDFVIRARSLGARTQALPFTVVTSARRYQTRGWLKTTLGHQIQAYRLITQAKRWRP